MITDQESVQNRLSYQGGHTARIEGLLDLSREKSAAHLKAYNNATDSALAAILALVEQLRGEPGQHPVPQAIQPNPQVADESERQLETFRLQGSEIVHSMSQRMESLARRLENQLRDLESHILIFHNRINGPQRFHSVEDGEVLVERTSSVFPDLASTVNEAGGLEKRVAELEDKLKEEQECARRNEKRIQALEELLLRNQVSVDFFQYILNDT